MLKYLQALVQAYGIFAMEVCTLNTVFLTKQTFSWGFAEGLQVEKMHSAQSSCLTTVVSETQEHVLAQPVHVEVLELEAGAMLC